jgi:transposase-like protein
MERTLSLNAVPKKYDEAFKRQAVEMVVRGGKRVREVPRIWGRANTRSTSGKRSFSH